MTVCAVGRSSGIGGETIIAVEMGQGLREKFTASLPDISASLECLVQWMASELLRTTTVKDLAEMFPERFNNKTRGVTPRRWLLLANPALAHTITEAIGVDSVAVSR